MRYFPWPNYIDRNEAQLDDHDAQTLTFVMKHRSSLGQGRRKWIMGYLRFKITKARKTNICKYISNRPKKLSEGPTEPQQKHPDYDQDHTLGSKGNISN